MALKVTIIPFKTKTTKHIKKITHIPYI